MNPYLVLGVSETASAAEISAAYRTLAVSRHPDRHGNSTASHAAMVELNSAYELVRSPERRHETDAALRLVKWREFFSSGRLNELKRRASVSNRAASTPAAPETFVEAAAQFSQQRPIDERPLWIVGGVLIDLLRK